MRRFVTILPLFALLLASGALANEIDLIYWGDFQAQNLSAGVEWEGEIVPVGGAPLLMGMLNSLRPKVELAFPQSLLDKVFGASRPSEFRQLLIDAGNNFAGSPVTTQTRGLSQVKLLNRLGVDIFVPGAREFTYGWESLLEVSRKAEYTTLCANIFNNQSGTNLFPPTAVFRRNGVDVAVIGFTNPRFRHGLIRDGVLGLELKDIREETRQFVKSWSDSADVLVAVTNVGWQGDSLLAAEVAGLDIIIGSGDGMAFDPPRKVKDTIILQAGSKGRKLGRLTLDVDTAAHSLLRSEATMFDLKPGVITPDAGLNRFVKEMDRRHTRKLNHEIGRLAVDWNLDVRGPCNLAQWVADATHAFAPSAHLALINNGSLRKGLRSGSITERDLWDICPSENPLIVIQISGVELMYVIKRQLVESPDFLTWSGLRVEAEGDELKALSVSGVPVTEFDEFSLITTGLVWDNWEYLVGTPAGRDKRPSFYMPGNQREILIDAVKRQQVISKPLDGRWNVETPAKEK